MRSIRYRRGTKKYRHSKRKGKRYVLFTTPILEFGTLNRNYRIYDMDVLEKAYCNMSHVLTVDGDVKELIKSIKIKPGSKVVVDSLPIEPTIDIHDADRNKINVKLKITKITKHISDFSDIEDIEENE